MIATFQPPPTYLMMYDVSWKSYEAFLDELEGRHLRITYDRGTLEIMSKSHEHEFDSELLADLVRMLTFTLDIPIHSGGSTTFKKESLDKGLEPDKCFWIQNEARMRGRRKFDSDRDPPPDLALEIEVTRSALDRMGIYAALKVSEVWRWNGKTLHVHHLTPSGKYREKETSRAFPFLPMAKLLAFLKQADSKDETSLLRTFVDWLRKDIAPAYEQSKGKLKNGRQNGK